MIIKNKKNKKMGSTNPKKKPKYIIKNIFDKFLKLLNKLSPLNIILDIFALFILTSIFLNMVFGYFSIIFLFMGACAFVLILPNFIFPIFIKPKTTKRNTMKYKKYYKFFLVISVLLTIFLVGFIIFNTLSSKTVLPENPDNTTLVVLGSSTYKSGNPMPTLKKRLVTAGEYLTNNKSVNCVVTGGVNDFDLVEGEMMKKYIIENYDIEPDRIFVEGKSKDTHKNLLYAKDIIKENDLSEDILIITSDFHIYRASHFAETVGYENIYTLPTDTGFLVRTTYWFREIPSMTKAILIRYLS